MISKDILTVMRRETKLRLNKSFIIRTIFIPILMAIIVATQVGLGGMGSDSETNLVIAIERGANIEPSLVKTLDELDDVKSGLFKYTFRDFSAVSEFDQVLESETPALLEDDFRGVFLVSESAMSDKIVHFYSANPGNDDLRDKVGGAIDRALNLQFFERNNLPLGDIDFVQSKVDIKGFKVTKNGPEAESLGPKILGTTLALLLMLGIMFNAMPLLGEVANEKATRIYEVLLSSIKPRDLLWGKVIGTGLISTLQMIIWIVAVVLLVQMAENFGQLPENLHVSLDPLVISYYFINYLVGLFLFLTVYAGFAAAYDNVGDASGALWPIYFIILLPFYTIFSLYSNPANFVAMILSIAPFTSLYVMPARMAMIDVPLWQPALALAINFCLLYVMINGAGKIYRISVLSSGNTPSLRKLFTMMKEA